MHTSACARTHMDCVERPEDKLWELVLSLHHGEPRPGIQVIRLGSQCPYLLSHLGSR